MKITKRVAKYGLVPVLILGIPSLIFAKGFIQTSIQTDKSSSIGVGYSSLYHYKFDHCIGRPIKGYDWSGQRCYINGEMRSDVDGLSASTDLTVFSANKENWCRFRLVVVEWKNSGKKSSRFTESLTSSATRCHGQFSEVSLKKVDDTHYQLFVKEK